VELELELELLRSESLEDPSGWLGSDGVSGDEPEAESESDIGNGQRDSEWFGFLRVPRTKRFEVTNE
jgi:hypothetical protein